MKFFTSSCFGVTWVLSITTNKYFCFLRVQICGKHQPTACKASGVNWAKSNWNATGVLARLNINNDFSPFDHWSGNEAVGRKPKMLTYVFIIFSLLFLKSWEEAPQILPRLKAKNYVTYFSSENFINKELDLSLQKLSGKQSYENWKKK